MSQLISAQVIADSGVAFGTSGARGLVTQFTPEVCAAFTHAFVTVMKGEFEFSHLALAIDNRPSSYAIAMACASALQQVGVTPIYCGVIPTPALAYQAMQDEIPCIMITGSHIPFDRNGLKFYRPDGEITKSDEVAILESQTAFEKMADLPELEVNTRAAETYLERYSSLFDGSLLAGKRIGIYEHSSAGRDLYHNLFAQLGADVISLERSDEFVPIDTEAVSEEDKAKAKKWSQEFKLDAIFSTDGDGDRPLIADESGEWLRGDILGLLTAQGLGIEALAVPVSCNTAIELSGEFQTVVRTKIGSPYVIAEFAALEPEYASVAGFEANGGFLLGTDVMLDSGQVLKALPTRDALLPAMILFSLSKTRKISDLLLSLPQRVTHSDRIKEFSREKILELIAKAKQDSDGFIGKLGFEGVEIASIDETDGLRMTFQDGRIVHLRPSGNAPELRCYAEADTANIAQYLTEYTLNSLKHFNSL